MTGLHAALVKAAKHPHKGPRDTDASMLLAAAQRLDGGYEPGGSHTKQTVARVLRVVAAALDSHEPSGQVDHEQAYRDLRAGIEARVEWMAHDLYAEHCKRRASGTPAHGGGRCDRCELAAILASSVPATASEDATERCQEEGCGYTGPTNQFTTRDGTTRCYVCHHEHVCADSDCEWCTSDEVPAAGVTSSDVTETVTASSEPDSDASDGDREGLSDEEQGALRIAIDRDENEDPYNDSRHLFVAVESILAARLAEATAERDEETLVRRQADSAALAATRRAERAEARADALAEQVAAVEDLAAEARVKTVAGWRRAHDMAVDIRVALADPASALAARDAKVAAQALREAADAIVVGEHACVKPGCPTCAGLQQRAYQRRDLRARADEIERAAGGEVEQP